MLPTPDSATTAAKNSAEVVRRRRLIHGSSCSSGNRSTIHKLIPSQVQREEFVELVEIAKPKTIYHTGRMHFFAFDGFVLYTFGCNDNDFKQKVLHAIEFSNQAWSE